MGIFFRTHLFILHGSITNSQFSIDFDCRMRFVLALGLLYSMLCKLVNKTQAKLKHYTIPLEQCSNECRKAITLVNHNRRKQRNEPIRIRSKYTWLSEARENACERGTIGLFYFASYVNFLFNFLVLFTSNLVPRVLRLVGQRLVASRESFLVAHPLTKKPEDSG